MSEKKVDEKLINKIDETEKAVYNKIFGLFDKDKGDFIKVDVEEISRKSKLPTGRTIKTDEKTRETKVSLRGKHVEEWDKQEQLQYTVKTDLMLYGEIQQDTINLLDKEGYYFSNGDVYKKETAEINSEKEKYNQKTEIENEVDRLIKGLSEKEISSMIITIKLNGNTEEFVNDEKAGEKYLSKEAQIEKIKEIVKGFKSIVVVHSEEELQKLQEDFRKKQDKKKESGNKSVDNKNIVNKSENSKESKVKTQVYIRISEDDYKAIKVAIENEDIKIITNKVTSRDDKSGINLIIKSVDADNLRTILNKNNIPVLQDVDGNINWEDIKERSNKFENITVEELRNFQNKNNDKYNYIAFRKDDIYTIFVDRKCDIAIGASGKKSLKQIDSSIKEYRNNESIQKPKTVNNKSKNAKEVTR